MTSAAMGKTYIPDWLQKRKGEFLTCTYLDRCFQLEKNGKVFNPSYLARKMGWLAVKTPQKRNSHGYVWSWRVKDIIARATAHGFSPIQRDVEERTLESQATSFLKGDIRRLQETLHQNKLEIASLKQQLVTEQIKTDFAKKMVREALAAQEIQNTPGVYFLCDENSVVYVGKSDTSVLKRVDQRANLMSLAKMIPAHDTKSCAELEKKWIRWLQPRANISLKNGAIDYGAKEEAWMTR